LIKGPGQSFLLALDAESRIKVVFDVGYGDGIDFSFAEKGDVLQDFRRRT
jgi:hypothetical protein